MTPLVYKKSKKSDKMLIETKNLSKGLFAMNIITQNIRYYPHDLNTKFYAVRTIFEMDTLYLWFAEDTMSLNLPFLGG